MAAENGHTEAVALLIEAKCDVDKAEVCVCVCVCVLEREREGGCSVAGYSMRCLCSVADMA
eukprot:1845489-Rhodomonas_salina.1